MTTENDSDTVQRLEDIDRRWETAPDQEKQLLAEELRGLVAGRGLDPARQAQAEHLATTIEASLTVPGP